MCKGFFYTKDIFGEIQKWSNTNGVERDPSRATMRINKKAR